MAMVVTVMTRDRRGCGYQTAWRLSTLPAAAAVMLMMRQQQP